MSRGADGRVQAEGMEYPLEPCAVPCAAWRGIGVSAPLALPIEKGDLIKTSNPFYAGVVIGEAKHKLGEVWIVDGGDGKRSMIFKDEAILWTAAYGG